MGVPVEDSVIHLTDLSFEKYCQEKFGINRGVYNTIDSWFYNKGVADIVARRKTIIRFLQYSHGKSAANGQSLKFGHGGLRSRLDEYWTVA
jgi:hypothetical protein